jgi:uncharacterized protein
LPSISIDAARAVLLAAQGLRTPPATPARKADVLAAIRRMGALQIDTISVVARSHLLVLWTRLGAFEPQWLDELLAEGEIFEGWSHAACFIPAEDYPLYRPAMVRRAEHPRYQKWFSENAEVADRVLDRIRRGGAARTADFERRDGRAGEWWDWKPEKRALDALYDVGILAIARRESFQRVYDLTERVRPEWNERDLPSDATVAREFALKSVRALGAAPARWVPDYCRQPKKGYSALLESLADEGALARVSVPELSAETWYVHPDSLGLVEAAGAGELASDVTTLLSPFDPVVWDRARASGLFGFDYRIEVYTPRELRKFGYFTLPILHRGRLVGRLCPKAHRREGVFEIRHLHLEPGEKVTEDLVTSLAATLKSCAAWHRTPEVIVRQTDPSEFGEALIAAKR